MKVARTVGVKEIELVGDEAGTGVSSSLSPTISWQDVKSTIENGAKKARTSLYLNWAGALDGIILSYWVAFIFTFTTDGAIASPAIIKLLLKKNSSTNYNVSVSVEQERFT